MHQLDPKPSWCDFVWYPYIKLLFSTKSEKVFPNRPQASFELLGSGIGAHMPVLIFPWFNPKFVNCPIRSCLICHFRIDEMKSLEPLLFCRFRYCIDIISGANHFGHLLHLSNLISTVMKYVSNALSICPSFFEHCNKQMSSPKYKTVKKLYIKRSVPFKSPYIKTIHNTKITK